MTTDFDSIITGAEVAFSDGLKQADIGINDGRIAYIGPTGRKLTSPDKIDGRGLWAFPGGVDSHCHIDQPGDAERGMDDYRSATAAALCGGTTTVIPFAMPAPGSYLVSDPLLAAQRAIKRAHGNCLVDYALHAVFLPGQATGLSDRFAQLAELGITSVKIFMTYAGYALGDEEILTIMDQAAQDGIVVMLHAENDQIIRYLTNRLARAGKTALRWHSLAHHGAAEHDATCRMTCYAEVTGAQTVILHVSGKRSLLEISSARTERQVAVLAETCPQYLFTDPAALQAADETAAHVLFSPPARSAKEREALWKGLADGSVAIWSSDHSPALLDAKTRSGEDASFLTAVSGVPGLETRLPLLFSEGLLSGHLSLERYLALASSTAAQRYGLGERKGRIAIGQDADIVLWDPHLRWRIEYATQQSRAGYCPYEGHLVTGKPQTALLRGKTVLREGVLCDDQQSEGQFLKRRTDRNTHTQLKEPAL